jgi:hypothetical protein
MPAKTRRPRSTKKTSKPARKPLAARAKQAGRNLVSRMKRIRGKKLVKAAAAAVGIGVAALGTVAAVRKSRRRKRRLSFRK